MEKMVVKKNIHQPQGIPTSYFKMDLFFFANYPLLHWGWGWGCGISDYCAVPKTGFTVIIIKY
jgi:hypothetical protein